MAWDSNVPEAQQNSDGTWLCHVCGDPATFSHQQACTGCSLAQDFEQQATDAQAALEAAKAAEAQPLSRVVAALADQPRRVPDPADQEAVAVARLAQATAARDLTSAQVYAEALAAEHTHPVFTCDTHEESA